MDSGRHINYLPDELLLEIFSSFTTEDLAMIIQHVSYRWKEVSQDNSLWRKRAFSPAKTTTDNEIIHHLKNMPMLRKFSPQHGFRIQGIIETLCKTCTNIHQLEFAANQRVPLHTLRQILAAFPNLAHLKIPVSNDVDHFSVLCQFKSLITLNFTECYLDIDQNVLSIIADECSMQQHLNMRNCTFPDQDIRYFLEKKKYQLLSLSIACYIST